MSELSLDRCYAIRADAIGFISDSGAGDVPAGAVVDEIVRLHPDVPRPEAERLVRRVTAHWGLGGLDYDEAPKRADGLREWYPVRRDGRLERVPLAAITEPEVHAIQTELRAQARHAFAEAGALDELAAARA